MMQSEIEFAEAAEVIRLRISRDALASSDASEQSYNKLVLWMLW